MLGAAAEIRAPGGTDALSSKAAWSPSKSVADTKDWDEVGMGRRPTMDKQFSLKKNGETKCTNRQTNNTH